MIECKNLSLSFSGQRVFGDLSVSIFRGEFVSIVGETGSGKTSFLRLLYNDLLPDGGTVKVGDFTMPGLKKRDLARLRRTLGIVFQDYKLLEDRTVYDNVAFALEVTGRKRQEIGKRVLRVLSDVGLSHKRNNLPHELSGGEQQRVVIARALAPEPLVLLADEPTGNLDPAVSREILQLLTLLNRQGATVVLATHDYELVRESGGRILRIEDGTLKEMTSI